MRIVVPPIKSQGIKTKLVPWIMEVASKTKYSGRWIEPFLGTGVVAFNARPDKALLNDINPHIINFYSGIQEVRITPLIVREYLRKEGAELLSSAENGYVHFRKVRDRFNQYFSPLDLLFLSRAGFNGMMRFGKKGNWNIPFCKKPNRFQQAYITKIVNQVKTVQSIIKKSWQFSNNNFAETILRADKDDIIYCDPPYFGRYVDYYNGWTEQDERKLFELLSTTRAKFILSTWHHNNFRENTMVKELWCTFNVVTKDHFYHGGGKIENRNSVVEALVFNFDADIEKHQRPKQKHVMPSLFPLETPN